MGDHRDRKLVIGYQDTPQGLDALALGRLLTEALDAHPTAATVPLFAIVMPWSKHLLSAQDLETALYLEADEPFKVVQDRLGDLHPETRALASHSPAGALFTLAEEEGALALVVGSSHRGRLGRVLSGSVGTSLLHGAPCAVAIAPAGYAERSDLALRRIGVAIDGAAEGWVAFATALRLAQRLGAHLTVITVAEPEGYGYGYPGAALEPAAAQREHEPSEHQRVLDQAMSAIPEGVDAEARLLSGPPGQRLAAISGELDLLLVGSRGYGPVRGVAVGSVSRHLVNEAECPILVLPRGAGDDPLGLATPEGEA